jgi:hypothetical protein
MRRLALEPITDRQIEMLAEIAKDIGQISLASSVIPFIFPDFMPEKIMTMWGGLMVAFLFWGSSIMLIKKVP